MKKEHYEIIDRIHNLKIEPTGEHKDYDPHFTSLRTILVEILEILRVEPPEEEHIRIMYYDGPCRCNEFRGKFYAHLYGVGFLLVFIINTYESL